MALALTRREGEDIYLTIDPNISNEQMRELLREGIQLRVMAIHSNQVRLAFVATKGVHIMRSEIERRQLPR
jgi:sRNA-binding carbon storage regulator CsrA